MGSACSAFSLGLVQEMRFFAISIRASMLSCVCSRASAKRAALEDEVEIQTLAVSGRSALAFQLVRSSAKERGLPTARPLIFYEEL